VGETERREKFREVSCFFARLWAFEFRLVTLSALRRLSGGMCKIQEFSDTPKKRLRGVSSILLPLNPLSKRGTSGYGEAVGNCASADIWRDAK
jgi:hypothetical protein